MAFCARGWGEATAGGLFKQGHDQRLRTRLEERAGGLVALSRLVDAVEDFANGRLDPELFAQQVRRQFGR